MKIEYALLVVLVSAVYALVKNFVPDLPISAEVFQVLIGYLLVKLGVEIVGKPADGIRKLFNK